MSTDHSEHVTFVKMLCIMSNMLCAMPLVLLCTQEVSPRLRTQREHEMPEPNMRLTFAILARYTRVRPTV